MNIIDLARFEEESQNLIVNAQIGNEIVVECLHEWHKVGLASTEFGKVGDQFIIDNNGLKNTFTILDFSEVVSGLAAVPTITNVRYKLKRM